MKFSTSLVLVLAWACAMVMANPHANAKHQSRKVAQTHHKERSAKQNNEVVESGADSLSRALDVVTPLAREAFSLGSDLASRVINGGSESKEGRAFDANLLTRVDSLISESSRAYRSLASGKLAASVASKASAVASLAKAAKAAAAAAVSGH